jgi:rubrerythrin
MRKLSGIVPPRPNQEQVLKCEQCGHVFMGKPNFLFPPKCPKCGGADVKKDNRVSY